MTIKSTILPALPGYFVLSECGEADDSVSAVKTPVIAWVISGYADRKPGDDPPIAEPVCYDDQSGSSAILAPDGTVTSPYSGSWDSLDDWVAHRNEERQRAKAKEAQTAQQPKPAPPATAHNPFAPRDNNTNKSTLTLKGGRGVSGS